MVTFGLVVEGNYDAIVLQTLIEKIRPVNLNFISRPVAQKGKLSEKFQGYLNEYKFKSVNKALIIRDKNNKCVKKILEKMVE